MGYVLNLLLALGALAAFDEVLGRELPWAVPLLAVAPYLLGGAARYAYLGGWFRLGGALERVLVVSPPFLQLAATLGLGWQASLARWSGERVALEGWPDGWLLAALAPFFLYQCVAVDARARCLAGAGADGRSARSFQLRLFLSALLPFLLYVGAAGLVARQPALRIRIEQVGLLGALWTAALFLALVWFLPFFLRHAWSTSPLERGAVRAMLEAVARQAGFRCRELLVWRTGNQMANAAIVGFTAGTRRVFFSDLLLAQLGPRELAAVFAHEMGHARRAHAAVFAAYALLFLLAADLFLTWSGVSGTAWTVGVLALVLVLWYLSFGFLSRRFELEADLESLRLLGEGRPLVRALELVTGAHAHRRSSWRHFSTRDRVAFLERAGRDPVAGIKLRLALARWRKLGFGLCGLALALELAQFARSWDEDWIVADLRLGRYEQAAARAYEDGVGEEPRRLAHLAASLAPENRDLDALERAAREALAGGDRPRARDLLELAVLRGHDELEPAVRWLDGDDSAGEELPAPWRESLLAR